MHKYSVYIEGQKAGAISEVADTGWHVYMYICTDMYIHIRLILFAPEILKCLDELLHTKEDQEDHMRNP